MDDLNHNGVGFDRISFVADAAVRIAASYAPEDPDKIIAAWAFDTAEALWEELCRRYPDDSTKLDQEAF